MAELIPAALLAALVALQTFAIGRSLHLDARAVGLAVAGVAVWRRAPFVVVIVAAAAATAAARAWAPESVPSPGHPERQPRVRRRVLTTQRGERDPWSHGAGPVN